LGESPDSPTGSEGENANQYMNKKAIICEDVAPNTSTYSRIGRVLGSRLFAFISVLFKRGIVVYDPIAEST